MLRRLRAAWDASLYRQMFVEMWRSAPGNLVAFLVFLGVGVALSLLFVVAIGAVVDELPAAVQGGPGSTGADDVEVALAIAAALLIAQPVVSAFESMLSSRLGRRLEGSLRERVMRSALAPDTTEHLHDAEVTREISAATTVGTARFGPMSAVDALGPMLSSLLTGLAMCGLIVGFRWWLGIFVAAAWLQARRKRITDNLEQSAVMGAQNVGTRRQGYFRQLAMTPSAAKEIRVFGLGDWLTDRFHSGWLATMQGMWAARRTRRSSLTLTLLFLLAANVAAFVVITRAALANDIGLGELTVLLQAVIAARVIADPGAVTIWDIVFVFGASTLGGVGRLESRLGSRPAPVSELDSARSAPTSPVAPSPPRISSPVHDTVRFEGVSFRYPSHDRLVLDGLDLTLPAGRSLAIVGENGVGKTTLVRLLAGLMTPTAGSVTVDGRSLGELDVDAWRAQIAVVFQDFARFPVSVRDNISFGAAGIALDDDVMRELSQRANLTGVIDGLPAGHDTPLSAQMRGGSDISGGEWQRVALARALAAVHAGASVLVLDEPTANLDVRSEAAFYERFLEITRGLTTVVISHRFATVRRADTIAVLADGQITELGSHAELIEHDGAYAHLFRLQAATFDDATDAENVN